MEFEKAIAIDWNNGWAHYELGKIYRRQGRWPEAEAALHKALEFNPQNEGARLELGALYLEQDRLAEAATEFEQAMAKDRNNGWAYFQLGRVCRRQGRLPEAEAALHEALELDPQNGCAHIELGALYEDQKRLMPAAAELEKAIAMDPNNGWALCQLGRIYRKKKRLPEAEAAFKNALAIDPRVDGVCIELGILYKDQDRLAEAEAAFQKAIACDPRHGEAHVHLGNVYRRQGRWGEAEAEFNEAIAIDPRHDRAFMGLWAIYSSQGRTAEAEAAAGKASAMNPKNAWARITLTERLDLDKAVSADATQGRTGPAGMDITLLPSLAQDVSKELMRERVFCLLPWTHLHIRTNGLSFPCCAWSGPPLGNVRSSSIAELWNSPGMKAVRLDMMSGRPVSGCSACYENEESGFLSTRQRSNIELGCHRGRERLTAADGALSRLPVPLLDIRFSNVCNLRCRTCEPTQSSAWAADAEALGLPVKGGPSHKPFADWDSLWRELQPLLEDGLEEIRFVGGEPLLMEEHYRILDFLIARKRTDVRLNYTTNFSTLRYQGRDVIDLWARFRNVHVAASLDGSGRRGEYLRKGLRWDTVEANREEMLRRCPDVKFSISVTVSIFNALHLPDFHREWSKKGYIEHDEFALNMLVAPAIYQAQALPPVLKRRVLEAYRRHRESFLDAAEPAARDFAAAASFMAAQDRSELLPEFVAMTRRLDALRGEDCREVFPELAALFEAAA